MDIIYRTFDSLLIGGYFQKDCKRHGCENRYKNGLLSIVMVLIEVYVKEFGAEVLSQQVHLHEKHGEENAEFSAGFGSSKTMAEPPKNSKEAKGQSLVVVRKNVDVVVSPLNEELINVCVGNMQCNMHNDVAVGKENVNRMGS
ncbi:hypothetical protein PIB30_027621 [Stylosanthes scabra]|uniref:Uncharacterized protein n=1 Tax=Stylosanthes scabra TaxID=79078 RepID=A0ABU6Z7H4_9FABA|nr:hypothetical protein [Stylosanthes scabra]